MTDGSAFAIGKTSRSRRAGGFPQRTLQLIRYATETGASAPALIVPPMHQQVLHPRSQTRELVRSTL